MSKWCDTLKALVHRHKMEKVAHWCDKECSIIIVEYKCTDCDHEAWDFVYFDDTRCKVLTRVPVEVSALDATKLVQCGEQICEQANSEKTNSKRQRRVAGSEPATSQKERKQGKAQA